MATTNNRKTRRTAASKSRSAAKPKTPPAAPPVPDDPNWPPPLSEVQVKRLREMRDASQAVAGRIADLEVQKAVLVQEYAARQAADKKALEDALAAAGIDLQNGPGGSYSVDFDTGKVTFTAAPDLDALKAKLASAKR